MSLPEDDRLDRLLSRLDTARINTERDANILRNTLSDGFDRIAQALGLVAGGIVALVFVTCGRPM